MTRDSPGQVRDPVGPRPSSLAQLGALIGDPVRAAILLHLSDGSRRPAGELSVLAGASPQAASQHLGQLVEGGLLRVDRQGRHRFFSIASSEAAEMIEALAIWVDQPAGLCRHDPALREARLCYDHLAGRLGVAIFDRMGELGLLALGPDGPSLSADGAAWCDRVGVAVAAPAASRRPLLRLCLDWTERRHHAGGHLGAALASRLLEAGFVDPGPGRRALLLTARGADFLRAELGMRFGPGPRVGLPHNGV